MIKLKKGKTKKNKPTIDGKKVKEFLSNRETMAKGAASLSLILVFALAYFILRPINISYKDSKINIENLKKEKEILTEKKVKLNNLEKSLKENEMFIARVEDSLPGDSDIPEILVTLEEIAKKHSLYISNLSPKEVTEQKVGARNTSQIKKEEWKTTMIQFDLVGRYLDMKNFIEDLEENIRPVNIKSVKISGGGQYLKGSPQPLRFSISAHIYHQTK